MYRILLTLSVLLNVALTSAVYLRSHTVGSEQPAALASADAHAALADEIPRAVSPTTVAPESSEPSPTTPSRSSDEVMAEFRDMITRLRSNGVPDETLRIIAQSLANEALAEKARREASALVHYEWQKIDAGRMLPADRQNALDEEREALVREILAGSVESTGAPREFIDDPRLAAIPLEKREQLHQLQVEQSRARSEIYRTGQRPQLPTDLEAARVAAMDPIRAVLSPEEYDHYMLYFSQEAKELQRALITTDINDEQYAAIYHALKDARKDAPSAGTEQVNLEVDLVQRIGGTDAALDYAFSREGTFRGGIEILKSANLSSAEILNRRRIYLTVFDRVPEEGLEARFARIQRVYDDVTAGLSPEARTALDQTNVGRQFATLLRRPAP
ncbi:MAG: hypothetical protein IAE82_15095 [Opitutaceae bacterium]|nr:hypothetical protein [Opitutaceae bacterium]